jgi:transglutaminase-like putative cysteine protease
MLHRRLTNAMAAAALLAFIAGAGHEAPAAWLALAVTAAATVWRPTTAAARVIEPLWRVAAVLLAARAVWHILFVPADVVLPMVDLLLLLLCSEALRHRESTSDFRLYSLSLALLLASAAYRPGIGFALAFVAYVVFGTVALMVGHVQRTARRHGVRDVPLCRSFVWRIAALSGVVLVASGAVFMTFPRLTRGFGAGPPAPSRAVVGFGETVSLGQHGARIEPNPEVVLRIEFPGGTPERPERLYWRGRSYDRFDGVRWSRSSLPRPGRPPAAGGWPGPAVEQVIYARPLEVPVLFGLHPIMSIRPRSAIAPFRDEHGDVLYAGRGVAPVYSVTSRAGRPSPAALRQAADALPPGGNAFLQLPTLGRRVHELADSLAATADNRYDRAVAVERWFHRSFEYTLELPRNPREATLEHFLFERRAGHCEYFSTGMVVLLRAMGIPARNVNGFAGGVWNDFGNYLTVTQNEAHSWVEVWFDGVGWVPFDPTPPAPAGAGGAASHRFAALRFLLDGFEHRWGKWVLDYGLDTQLALFRRAVETLERPAPLPGDGAPRVPGAALAVLLGFAAAALGLGIRVARRGPATPAATARYLALRRAYAGAGWDPDPAAGPLAFAEMLRRRSAPGAAPARHAINLYASARFSGRALDARQRRDLARSTQAATAELRRARRRRR